MDFDEITPQEITRKLKAWSTNKLDNPYPYNLQENSTQPAAVLIPLLRKKDSWQILFIRRTEIPGDRHSGQVAFPGGVCDSSDNNAEEAAMRETHEEIGIDPKDITILGKLNRFLTVTNFIVTPIVGMIPWPYPLRLEPKEVSRAFTIPLAWLNNPTHRESVKRELLNGKSADVIYFNEFDGEILWGASARITLTFLNVLNSSDR
jgi:8-oxo-dGTP pyrophosphatase MutT (NUDIX family)